ncbi:hypothetical protein CDAR_102831 [Caerostris darwini]|uniref:Uncharacterized protein n=1 Tax=Caerostris darwini TaxID=1538125 RepID=A0AAV4P644_9ARAC|nr:hypothetical protein CDAR_102831 [Caerostris darwini]
MNKPHGINTSSVLNCPADSNVLKIPNTPIFAQHYTERSLSGMLNNSHANLRVRAQTVHSVDWKIIQQTQQPKTDPTAYYSSRTGLYKSETPNFCMSTVR